MFCSKCGQDNPDNNLYCAKCGQALNAAAAAIQEGSVSAQASPPFAGEATTDGKAIASLILGVLGLTVLWILAGIPAIVLGHLSRSNIRKSMGRLKGEGMALAGLIMGYLSVAAIPLILIIAAIAIPNLLRSRNIANESSAIGMIRTINTAAVTYAATDGKGAFPTSLKQMGPEPDADGKAANLITSDLANGTKSGYIFTYEGIDADGDEVIDSYFVIATPITVGTTGIRSFCSDQTGVVRAADRSETCTAESTPI